jgi:hypothetical protein
MRKTSASTLIAAITTTGAALLASGCAAGTVSTGTAPPGTATTHEVALARTPAQLASAAARRLLGEFAPPPGSARYQRQPAGDHGALTSPGGFVSGAMVQDTGWWLASGPDDVIAYERAHLPRGFRASFSSSGSGSGLTQAFELLPDKAPLTKQYLIVSIAAAGGGKTAVRVDADVAYQPARPATERVPATARVVTITQTSGYPGSQPPPPVTVTRPATVAAIVAYVNGLPLSTAPRDAPCSSAAVDFRLDFRERPGGPLLAVAGGPVGCDILNFILAGRPQPPLDGSTFNQRIAALAGLHWKLLP